MIFVKRLLPLLVLAGAWAAYSAWNSYQSEQQAHQEAELALVTAQVWVATALYRDDPDRYLAYRDSLLDANDVDRDEVFAFLEGRESQSEDLLGFTQQVQRLVDSLSRVQDSLIREEKIRLADSVRAAALDTNPAYVPR